MILDFLSLFYWTANVRIWQAVSLVLIFAINLLINRFFTIRWFKQVGKNARTLDSWRNSVLNLLFIFSIANNTANLGPRQAYFSLKMTLFQVHFWKLCVVRCYFRFKYVEHTLLNAETYFFLSFSNYFSFLYPKLCVIIQICQ